MKGAGVAAAVLASTVLALVGCGGEEQPSATPEPSARVEAPVTTAAPSTAATTTTTTAPPRPADLAAVSVRLTEVTRLAEPIDLVSRPGEPGVLYLAERGGRVVALRDGRLEPVLDLTPITLAGGEKGLLSIAFSPDGARLYVHHSDPEGHTVLAEYAMAGGAADATSRRVVLFHEHPRPNHNGGEITFGPDGLLYFALGDGGGGGDPDENAQDRSSLLGKILRLDPRQQGQEPYGVPVDNPFVDQDGMRSEVWTWGLRNPWRFSFDRSTGDLWVADVGQNAVEEVHRLAAPAAGRGSNLGWDLMEGDRPYEDGPEAGLVAPVYTYTHDTGACAVTGGYVYRGEAIPDLVGAYVFADYCLRGVTALAVDGTGAVTQVRDLGLDVDRVVSFAEDEAGELYVLSFQGTVARIDPA